MNISKEKLIIVGAGISGLYLAHLLEEKFEITILEARARIGGRIYSIEEHDVGPSWIWSHHVEILSLLKSLDIKIFPQHTNGYALYDTKDAVEAFTIPNSQASFRVDKTLSSLINKLKENLKSTKIILNTSVLNIKKEKDFIEIKSSNNIFKADKVIVAIPPRLCAKIDFFPSLDKKMFIKLSKTHTWMANSCKCVIEFKKAFWKEKQLSGFVFSNQGPLSEIHDASTKDKAALFGFLGAQASRNELEKNIKIQLLRVFKIEESEIGNIYCLDWQNEEFTATKEDTKPLKNHPEYGISLTHFDEKILFSSTEFSFEEGGYLEGALLRAQEIANIFLRDNS